MGHKDKIPFFGLAREYLVHKKAYLEIADRIFSHGQILQGNEVKEFEKDVANLCKRNYAISINSCTDGLYFSLLASGVQSGDEVLVTNFSFVASASCILRVEAKPVFVDINENFLMDLDKAKQLITNKTKAILFVHLYGQMGNPNEIISFAEQNNLVLIEDSAQAFGASYNYVRAGSIGHCSCLSFDPTKVLAAPASGGMVLTDDKNIAKKIKRLRYHGKDEQGEFVSQGFNSQMSTFVAAILNYKLNQNSSWLDRRRKIAEYYINNLGENIIAPLEIEGSKHIYHKFVIRLKMRDKLKQKLLEDGIETMIHYKKPLNLLPLFQNNTIENINLIKSISASSEVLSLPIHPFLKDSEIEFIVDRIRKNFK